VAAMLPCSSGNTWTGPATRSSRLSPPSAGGTATSTVASVCSQPDPVTVTDSQLNSVTVTVWLYATAAGAIAKTATSAALTVRALRTACSFRRPADERGH
jgi:hypothetical protein